MKTTQSVISDRPEYKTLINAVIRGVGRESVPDINNHGIDGGFGGFIYYSDTVKFYRRHKKAIIAIANELADEFGQSALELIKAFNCLNNNYSIDEIGETLYGGPSKQNTQIANALAWFAAEEVCHWFED